MEVHNIIVCLLCACSKRRKRTYIIIFGLREDIWFFFVPYYFVPPSPPVGTYLASVCARVCVRVRVEHIPNFMVSRTHCAPSMFVSVVSVVRLFFPFIIFRVDTDTAHSHYNDTTTGATTAGCGCECGRVGGWGGIRA